MQFDLNPECAGSINSYTEYLRGTCIPMSYHINCHTWPYLQCQNSFNIKKLLCHITKCQWIECRKKLTSPMQSHLDLLIAEVQDFAAEIGGRCILTNNYTICFDTCTYWHKLHNVWCESNAPSKIEKSRANFMKCRVNR